MIISYHLQFNLMVSKCSKSDAGVNIKANVCYAVCKYSTRMFASFYFELVALTLLKNSTGSTSTDVTFLLAKGII